VLIPRLQADPRLLEGTWATAARRDLPSLLRLPDEVVAWIPDLRASRRRAAAH
jgi:hypothetical protein